MSGPVPPDLLDGFPEIREFGRLLALLAHNLVTLASVSAMSNDEFSKYCSLPSGLSLIGKQRRNN